MSKPIPSLSKQPSFPLTDLIPYAETKAQDMLMFLFYSLLLLRAQGPCIHREALRKPGMLNSLGWRGNKKMGTLFRKLRVEIVNGLVTFLLSVGSDLTLILQNDCARLSAPQSYL